MEKLPVTERFSIIHHVEWLILMLTLVGGFYLLDSKIERQAARTDKLYEMFIELVRK